MQLFNQGKRVIIAQVGEIQPGQIFEVTEKEGKLLQSLYATEIVEPPVLTVKEDKNLELLQADLAAVTAERDEAKKQLELLQADLAKAQKQIEKLEAKLSK